MKMHWKWMGLLLLAPLLNGCAPSQSGPSFGNLGRNFADDWTGTRSLDSATTDLEHGDIQGVEAAGRALDARISNGSRGSLNIAASWMAARLPEATQSDLYAQNTEAGPDHDRLRRESNRSYRAALAFLPSDESKWRSLDPITLNALGYFLADRGHSRADFERAEKLTSLAIELSPARNSAERFVRAQGAEDSHAWALFRLGQTKAALQAQAEVISTLGVQSDNYGLPSAEVIYHWGAICRVAGQENAARDAFQTALTLKPSPELREILETNLSGVLV